jgi:hypothetical protein
LRARCPGGGFHLAGLAEHIETFDLKGFNNPAVVEFGDLVRRAAQIAGAGR